MVDLLNESSDSIVLIGTTRSAASGRMLTCSNRVECVLSLRLLRQFPESVLIQMFPKGISPSSVLTLAELDLIRPSLEIRLRLIQENRHRIGNNLIVQSEDPTESVYYSCLDESNNSSYITPTLLKKDTLPLHQPTTITTCHALNSQPSFASISTNPSFYSESTDNSYSSDTTQHPSHNCTPVSSAHTKTETLHHLQLSLSKHTWKSIDQILLFLNIHAMFECQAVGLNFAEGSSTAKARIASIRHKKMLYLGVDMHLLKCFAQYFGAHINDKSLCGSASTTIFEKTVSDPPPTISTHFNLHCDASRTSAHIYEQIDPYFIIDMDQSPLSPTHTSNSIGDIKIKCLQRLMDELSMIDSGFTTPTTHNRSCRHIVINSLGSEIELKKTQWMYRHVDPNGFHIHSHALFSVDNMSLQSCSSNRIRDDDSTRNANVELNEKRVEPPLDIIKQAEPNGSNKMRLHDPENTRNSTELLIAARESAQVSWWEHRTIRMDYPVDRVNPLSPTSTLADTRPNQETPFEKRTSLPISQGHPNEALHQHTRTVSATPSPYNHNHGTNTQSVGTISGQSRINSMPAITTGNTWLQLPCGSEPLKPESAVTKQVTRLVNELQFWKKSPGPLLRMPAHTTKNRGVRMQEPVQTIEEYRSLSTTPMIQEPATMEIVVKLWIRRTWWIDFCNFPDKT